MVEARSKGDEKVLGKRTHKETGRAGANETIGIDEMMLGTAGDDNTTDKTQ